VVDREEKRAQFEEPRHRGGFARIIVLAVGVLLAAGAGFWAFLGENGGSGKYPAVSARAGEVALPLEEISDGQAHFFSYRHQGETIDFFVLKSHDGVIRTAFDACDVCYQDRKGYRQEGDAMVCINCGQRFPSDLINEVRGGCNPAPLKPSIRDGQLVIAEAALLEGAWYFQQEKI